MCIIEGSADLNYIYFMLEKIYDQMSAPKNRPRIVCLCGSTRFIDIFRIANLKETIAGKIVLSIGCDTKSDADLLAAGLLTKEIKIQLDELHKRKIDISDEILVLSVDGYIGDSTKSEIEYAKSKGKSIRYWESEANSKDK